jgi:hypothetical protein
MYQLPLELVAPKFTIRNVTTVPDGTFCSAATLDKSMGDIDEPVVPVPKLKLATSVNDPDDPT